MKSKEDKIPPRGPDENSLEGWAGVIQRQAEESRKQVELQRKYVTALDEETPLTEETNQLLELVGNINAYVNLGLYPYRGVTEEMMEGWKINMSILRNKLNAISAMAKTNNLL